MKNTISINDILETKKDEGSLYNIEAEQLVIGNLLTNNEALNLVNDFLQEEHFFEPLHQQIFNIINQYFDKGIVVADYRGDIDTFDPHNKAREWRIVSNTDNQFLLFQILYLQVGL